MTKKDYIQIARILGTAGSKQTDYEWQQVITMASADLESTNERFDAVKFIKYASAVRDLMDKT